MAVLVKVLRNQFWFMEKEIENNIYFTWKGKCVRINPPSHWLHVEAVAGILVELSGNKGVVTDSDSWVADKVAL